MFYFTKTISVVAIGGFVMALMAGPTPLRADALRDCNQFKNLDRKIKGCTELLESSKKISDRADKVLESL